MRLLFWLCSHSALSAFISLTTHYPVSSLKTDKAILHKSEKWWETTSRNTVELSWVCSLVYDCNRVRIFTKTGTYILLPFMRPNTNWKQNIEQCGKYIQSHASPHSGGFILHSQQCNQKEPNEKLVVALLRSLVCIINSAVKATAHTYTHIQCKHMHSGSHTLDGHISYRGIRIWNDSPNVEHLAEFACKSQRRATFSHCSPQNGLMIVHISAAGEASAC